MHDSLDINKGYLSVQKTGSRDTLFFTRSPGKRIDYVLVYDDSEKEKDREKEERREQFEANLREEGLDLEIHTKAVSITIMMIHKLV